MKVYAWLIDLIHRRKIAPRGWFPGGSKKRPNTAGQNSNKKENIRFTPWPFRPQAVALLYLLPRLRKNTHYAALTAVVPVSRTETYEERNLPLGNRDKQTRWAVEAKTKTAIDSASPAKTIECRCWREKNKVFLVRMCQTNNITGGGGEGGCELIVICVV